MPACNPRCPVVRAKLREIVTQAPWIQDAQVTARVDTQSGALFLDGKRVDKRGKLSDESLEGFQHAELRPHPDYRYDEDAEIWFDVAKPTDVEDQIITGETRSFDKATLDDRRRADAAVNSETISFGGVSTSTAIDEGGVASDRLTEADAFDPLRDIGVDTAEGSLRESRIDSLREAGTQGDIELTSDSSRRAEIDLTSDSSRRAEIDLTRDPSGRIGVDPTSESMQRTTGDSTIGPVTGADRMDRTRGTSEQRADLAGIQDDCEPNCPRRISRNARLRKLEERQSTVDAYLLDKGSGYFEDVCTCSLSCVVRALSDDPFVRSILTSAALFALGLKLCVELDAWYLPVRL